MIIGSIILFILVRYFLTRIPNNTDTSNNSRREKDGSMNLSVSIDYIKGAPVLCNGTPNPKKLNF